MVEKTTKHSGAEGETHNGDLETLMSQRKTKKQVYDGSTVTEKKKTSSTESKKAERDLQREQTLLQQQAEVNIVSPFLMQTITSGEAICGKVPVFCCTGIGGRPGVGRVYSRHPQSVRQK